MVHLLEETRMARRTAWLLIDAIAFSTGALIAGVIFVRTLERRW